MLAASARRLCSLSGPRAVRLAAAAARPRGGARLLGAAGLAAAAGAAGHRAARCEPEPRDAQDASFAPSLAAAAGAAAAGAAAAVAYGLRDDGSYGSISAEEAGRRRAALEAPAAGGGELPTFALEEFQRHTGEGSLWVTYGGAVYDVTDFIGEHPGGREALVSAGGQDLEVMWSKYHVHFRKDVLSVLAPYRIGSLSEEDARAAKASTEATVPARPLASPRTPHGNRAAARARRRCLRVWAVAAAAPLWWSLRGLLDLLARALPLLGPLLAERAGRLLPCSLPGRGGAARLPAVDPATGERARVAVVGGGIAGCACAYSLARSGYQVTIYESRPQLGGNAQTAAFPLGGGRAPVAQDLSVLFWAPEYYRNYSELLRVLGLEPVSMQLPYVIHRKVGGVSEFYTPPGHASGLDKMLQPSMEQRFEQDFRRYDRMIGVVSRCGDLFSWGSSRPTFYRTNQYAALSFANPFNYIGMRSCARMFGISSDFYETILRPFHALSLTTVHIDSKPATGYQVLDNIAPLHYSREVCTWGAGTSQEVFQRAAAGSDVLLDTRVRQVRPVPPAAGAGWRQTVVDDKGVERVFDRVVFACPATAADAMLRSSSWLERSLLGGVAYHDELHNDDWRDWLESQLHQDPRCLPEKHRAEILEHAAFLIDVDEAGRQGEGGGPGAARNVEFTHNLGAFSASARAAGVPAAERKMFMTQCHHASSEYDDDGALGTFSAPRGHPKLSYTNLVVTQLLHLVQGRRGVWYCSNWTSPGNGHDLACTSGLAVASAIGADYPLPCPEAARDHRDCRRFMCI